MTESLHLHPSQKSRDLLLILTLTELRATTGLIIELYSKVFDIPNAETVQKYHELADEHLNGVATLVAQSGDLDVDGLKNALGL